MFSIPRVNVIESTEGYSVEVLSRVGLIYTEDERSIKIDSEIISDPIGVEIVTDSKYTWVDLDNNKVLFSAEERERILNNIKSALIFDGYDVVIR